MKTDRQTDNIHLFRPLNDYKILQNTIIDLRWSLETHIKAIAAIMRATNSTILNEQKFQLQKLQNLNKDYSV